MRKAESHWDADKARALLARAAFVHLASTRSDGMPVLRALNAVLVGDLLAFHGAKAGESTGCLGRQAIASAESVVARIPSYFVDPERACPATTYYESVQVKGVLEEIVDLNEKASVIEALMQKYQGEGGYQPLEASNALYTKELRGLQVYGLRIAELQGKFNLGQRRKGSALAGIVKGLWQRGDDGDLQAIDKIIESRPEEALQRGLAPDGSRLRHQMGEDELTQVVDLLRGSYWNQSASDEEIARAHRNSSAWVGCVDTQQRVQGSARALADGSKFAWILDVIVLPSQQSKRLGSAMMEMLLDHPKVRLCRQVGLVTRDAQDFYSKFGFEIVGKHHPSGNHLMQLAR